MALHADIRCRNRAAGWQRMTLELHHIFACTSEGAPEARTLLDAGLVEGSANIHPGQGTANRRFFFARGFLELLWVHDEREARSAPGLTTGLWERWAGRAGRANPFGLCFSSENGIDTPLPFGSRAYQPDYLPPGRRLLFADPLPISEPEIFLLDWPQGRRSPENEPTHHPLAIRAMRSVSVGVHDPANISDTLGRVRNAGLVEVHASAAPELVIECTADRAFRHHFSALGLTLVGRRQTAG